MRNSLGRLTLRGARAIASSSTSRATTLITRPNFARRDLCTGSAISADAKHKSEAEAEPKDPARIVVLPEDAPEPSVQVLTADPDMPEVDSPLPADAHAVAEPLASEGVPETIGEETDLQPAAESGLTELPTVKTPEQMYSHLKDMLRKNATRSALFHYGSAFKTEGAPSIDLEVMKLMLPVLGRNSWAATAADTLNLASERGYSLGIGSANCGLHAMARSGMAAEITAVVDKMWAMPGDSKPNATSYNYLIGAHIYRGSVDEAFDVLNEMKKHLIYPTFATYHGLITGCLRRRDPRRAYQTLIAVEKQRFDISAMTVAQVLVSSANNDDYDHVNHLLAKFEECLPRYASELHRIAEFRGLYRLKDSQRTSKADRDVMRGDPKPEIGAISAVLHCAFRGGRVDIASRAWTLMEEHYPDFDIPLPLWYCLVGAYAGAGEFSQAIDIVGVMREKGLKPSMRDLEMSLIRPLAYDVNVIDEQYYRLCDRKDGKEPETQPSATASGDVVSGSADNDDSTTALDAAVVSELDEDPATKDLTGSADSAEGVDKADAHEEVETEIDSTAKPSGSIADALFSSDSSVAGESIGQRFRPKTVGIEELNCIIGACSASLDLDRAFQTFDEVETRFGVEKDIETYNALLEGCVQTRRLSGGMRVLEEIESVGFPISGYTLHLAARLMLRSGRSEELSRLLKKAHTEGDSILLQTYQMVLRQYVRAEDFDSATDLLKQGESEGFAFKGLTGRFDYQGVRRLRAAMSGKGDVSGEYGESEGYQDESFEENASLPGEADVEETKEDKQ